MAENDSEDAPDPKDCTDSSPDPDHDTDLAILCDPLQEAGITRVTIHYEGSGDSGSVQEIEYEPADITIPRWIDARLQETAEYYCPDGYENNEGGYGTLTIHPFLGVAELEHRDRYEASLEMDTHDVPLPDNLYQRLSQRGVRGIAAQFSGQGDSGQIDDLTVDPDTLDLDDTSQNELEDLLIDQLEGGWENNDGSYGTFTVDVPGRQVEVDAYWRVQKDMDAQVTRWQWRK